jgi:hypothetical protein
MTKDGFDAPKVKLKRSIRPKKQPFRPNGHRSVNIAIVRSKIANRRDTACRVQPKWPSFGQNGHRWFGQTQRGNGNINGGTDTSDKEESSKREFQKKEVVSDDSRV